MNFKGKGTGRDLIVYFSPAKSDFDGIRPRIYKPGQNDVVDKFVFNREKGALVGIQASQFRHARKTPCELPVEQRDPQPHLYCERMNGHTIHYKDNPDSPSYVRTVFRACGAVEVMKTKHDSYMVAGVVNGNINKLADGSYGIDLKSLKPAEWTMEKGTFERQRVATNEAKAYQKQKALEPEKNNISKFMAEDEKGKTDDRQFER